MGRGSRQGFRTVCKARSSGQKLRIGLRAGVQVRAWKAFRSGAQGRGSGLGPRQVSVNRSRQGLRASFRAGNESSGQGLIIGAQTRVSDQIIRSGPKRSIQGIGIWFKG